jgi:hypothetical protein
MAECRVHAKNHRAPGFEAKAESGITFQVF